MKECGNCNIKKKGLKRFGVADIRSNVFKLLSICPACRLELGTHCFLYKLGKGQVDIGKQIERSKADYQMLMDRNSKEELEKRLNEKAGQA